MIDRTTKVTLIAIAAALWLHLISPLWEPTPAHAQLSSSAERDIRGMRRSMSSIESDVSRIGRGLCLNGKIC